MKEALTQEQIDNEKAAFELYLIQKNLNKIRKLFTELSEEECCKRIPPKTHYLSKPYIHYDPRRSRWVNDSDLVAIRCEFCGKVEYVKVYADKSKIEDFIAKGLYIDE